MPQQARSFRLTCESALQPTVEDLLSAQGFVFENDILLPAARLLLKEPLPLGSSLASSFGYIYIQDRSSMLPPLALRPAPGEAVLDMCASPGGKTGLLGLMTGDLGFTLGNEPAPKRLGTLRRNLWMQNLFCCATASFPGENLPLPDAGWSAILLDPPCSGWGTADKHPQVLKIWSGDKIGPLAALQRKLLAEAARLMAPGALLSYSTCTTNVEENEDQVLYACQELGLELLPLDAPPGFSLAAPERPGCEGVWRVERGEHGQGFFVALLRKTESAPAVLPAADLPGQEDSSVETGFFVRPWERESRFVGERRRHGARQKSAREPRSWTLLDRDALAGPWLDPQRLPPGEVAVFNNVAHFLPASRGALLPPGFAWKGFPLGKVGPDGTLRTFSHLRRLMPAVDALRGAPALVLDDVHPLLDLLDGRSLAVDVKGPEIGLYYKDLPLCRLKVKGGRAMLPKSI
ncbi:RsmB/NOP family class I SAM-dependent RNA methyltransferase [Desulfovibrio sp. OttesenSCG-928-M16]|nr:RsmB/NOP family class I SAM-dependent RNA methyltransferase [Desulfovibrio sp. OttesenSCG-928-M16]